MIRAWTFGLCFFAIAGHANAATDPSLPPGEGREIVAAVCTSCHPSATFTQLREGPDAWRSQVFDMALHGAQLTNADMKAVVGYLATAFGPGNPVPDAEPRDVKLPDGAGRDLVQNNCVLCHSLGRITATRRPPRQWTAILDRMVFLGAALTAEEAKTAAEYLQANFSASGYSAPPRAQ